MKFFTCTLLLLITLLSSSCSRNHPTFSSQVQEQVLASSDSGVWRLKQGNMRFVSNQALHPNQSSSRLKEVAPKQFPFAIIVSCSDSRVPPEILFDQGIGDLFIVRTAGHVVDSAALASIEYAIEHLGASTVVVMGHESCGAVKAAMTTAPGKSAGSPSLDSLVAAIRPHIKDYEVNNPNDPKVRSAVSAHVDAVAKELIESSHIIKEFVEMKKLYFARALYNLEDGSVAFWAEGYPEVSHTADAHAAPQSESHSNVNLHQKSADPAMRR